MEAESVIPEHRYIFDVTVEAVGFGVSVNIN